MHSPDAHEIMQRFKSEGSILRKSMQDTALLIAAQVGDRRCMALALTKLEEAMMWAEKGM